MKTTLLILLYAAAAYAGAGALFAAAFHWKGLRKVDASAGGAGWGFRLLISPGLVALWPLLAARWWRAAADRTFLGEPASPAPPEALRRWHRLAWQGLAVVVPLLIAAALLGRIKPLPPQSLPSSWQSR